MKPGFGCGPFLSCCSLSLVPNADQLGARVVGRARLDVWQCGILDFISHRQVQQLSATAEHTFGRL